MLCPAVQGLYVNRDLLKILPTSATSQETELILWCNIRSWKQECGWLCAVLLLLLTWNVENGCWLLHFRCDLVHFFLLTSANYNDNSSKLYSFSVDNWLLHIVAFYAYYVFSLRDSSLSLSVWLAGAGWEFPSLENCNVKLLHLDVHGIKTWLFLLFLRVIKAELLSSIAK